MVEKKEKKKTKQPKEILTFREVPQEMHARISCGKAKFTICNLQSMVTDTHKQLGFFNGTLRLPLGQSVKGSVGCIHASLLEDGGDELVVTHKQHFTAINQHLHIWHEINTT